MDAAIIERQSQRAGGLDQLEMRGAANADLAAAVQEKKRVPGTQRDVAAAGDDGCPGVLFDSRRGIRRDFHVIAFDSSDDGRKILRRNMGIPDGQCRHDRQERDRENLRPGGLTLPLDRLGKHVYPQLPEGLGEAILTPTSTYTITACQNK